MNTPFVIDNIAHRLSEILNDLLDQSVGKPFDVATAYFSISGYKILKDGLHQLGAFRLLLGAEPQTGAELGIMPDPHRLTARIKGDLEAEPFTEETLKLVEDLIAYLQAEKVEIRLYDKGFLHAKTLFTNTSRMSSAPMHLSSAVALSLSPSFWKIGRAALQPDHARNPAAPPAPPGSSHHWRADGGPSAHPSASTSAAESRARALRAELTGHQLEIRKRCRARTAFCRQNGRPVGVDRCDVRRRDVRRSHRRSERVVRRCQVGRFLRCRRAGVERLEFTQQRRVAGEGRARRVSRHQAVFE
jgi:hypothetical protein